MECGGQKASAKRNSTPLYLKKRRLRPNLLQLYDVKVNMSNTRNKTAKKLYLKRINKYKQHVIICSTFFVLFFAMTVIATAKVTGDFHHWHLTHDGKKTPAKIISIEKTSTGGGRGGSSFSFDIEYEYPVKGRTIRSSVYGFNQKTWDQFFDLQEKMNSGAPAWCYISTPDGNMAIMDRELSVMTIVFWVLFPIAFCACSGLLLFCLLRSLNTMRSAHGTA